MSKLGRNELSLTLFDGLQISCRLHLSSLDLPNWLVPALFQADAQNAFGAICHRPRASGKLSEGNREILATKGNPIDKFSSANPICQKRRGSRAYVLCPNVDLLVSTCSAILWIVWLATRALSTFVTEIMQAFSSEFPLKKGGRSPTINERYLPVKRRITAYNARFLIPYRLLLD